MSSNALVEITSGADLKEKVTSTSASAAVLLFGASWHEACGPLEAVLSALAGTTTTTTTTNSSILFGKIDAEQVTDLTDQYKVEAVPTIVLVKNIITHNETITERLEGGVEPAQVTVAVQRLISSVSLSSSDSSSATAAAVTTTTTSVAADPQVALNKRLKELIESDSVMLFMKGNPTAPRCGFSRQAVELLQSQEIPFGSFDILTDESVRQGLKSYSNWPTYPQIYVNGELIGGLDILKELSEDDTPLKEQWNITIQPSSASASSTNPLQDRLAQLVKRHDVMVFMKGLPSAPRCGFSRQLIELLDDTGVSYDAFDILQDEEVRQGLKTFSNWPTYPQLYVKGDLVGGLDIVKELQESGELMDMLKQ